MNLRPAVTLLARMTVLQLMIGPFAIPAAEAQSFDCRQAKSPEEKAICNDQSLARLDEQLLKVYAYTQTALADADKQRVKRQQRDWLRSRKRCAADVGCLRQHYQSRIDSLYAEANSHPAFAETPNTLPSNETPRMLPSAEPSAAETPRTLDYSEHNPLDDHVCDFEAEIRDLTQKLEQEDYSKATIERANALRDLDELDELTRFTFCINQDGEATARFNTPEEDLKQRIGSIQSVLGWLSGTLGAVASETVQKITDYLGKIDQTISKHKDKAGTLKVGKEPFRVYEELTDTRKSAMAALATLPSVADLALCHGLTHNRLRLAEIYHRSIPANCNPYRAKALRDHIERHQPHGFSPFLDDKTYGFAADKCVAGMLENEKRAERKSENFGDALKAALGGTPGTHPCPNAAVAQTGTAVEGCQLYGSTGEKFRVKGSYICRLRGFDLLRGRTLQQFHCPDDEFAKCELRRTREITDVVDRGNGATAYYFSGGEVNCWITVFPAAK